MRGAAVLEWVLFASIAISVACLAGLHWQEATLRAAEEEAEMWRDQRCVWLSNIVGPSDLSEACNRL